MNHARTSLPFTLALLLAAHPAWAGAADATAPLAASSFTPATLCVAALESEIKSGLHAGATAAELDRWQRRAESAFAHTGHAYLDGLSEERAKPLLHAAKAVVATWPADRLAQHAQACHAQGQALFEQASGVQQWVVRRSAQRWLRKELAKLPEPLGKPGH
jgi:hypothetical protein